MNVPEHQIEAIARCLLPDILKFYENEEEQKEFEQWKTKRKMDKKQAHKNIK